MHDAYQVAALVGRTAVVKAVVEGLAEAKDVKVVPLRFGLSAAHLGDAFPAGQPVFVEFVHLGPQVMEALQRGSEIGPVAWIEAEWADGAGYHAAIVLDRSGRPLGATHSEGRAPVNEALAKLGVIAAGGKDELDACGLVASKS